VHSIERQIILNVHRRFKNCRWLVDSWIMYYVPGRTAEEARLLPWKILSCTHGMECIWGLCILFTFLSHKFINWSSMLFAPDNSIQIEVFWNVTPC